MAESPTPAQIEALAIEYHKATDGTGEGEYGCNGVECPGVQRLIALLKRAVDPLLVEGQALREEIAQLKQDLDEERHTVTAQHAALQAVRCERDAIFANGLAFETMARERTQELQATVAALQTVRGERDEAQGLLKGRNVLLLAIAGEHDKVVTAEAYNGVEAVRLCVEELSSALAASRQRETHLKEQLQPILDSLRGDEGGMWADQIEAALAAVDRPAALLDDRVRELWRSVQGPYAELTGPLIRFAALCFQAGHQQGESNLNWVRAQRDVAEEKARVGYHDQPSSLSSVPAPPSQEPPA